MLDYAGCVLNNWERIDPRGPLVPSNVRLLRRFTGLVDEAGTGLDASPQFLQVVEGVLDGRFS